MEHKGIGFTLVQRWGSQGERRCDKERSTFDPKLASRGNGGNGGNGIQINMDRKPFSRNGRFPFRAWNTSEPMPAPHLAMD